MIAKLKELQLRFPRIGDVRGLGSMVALELVKDPETRQPDKEAAAAIIKICFDNGLITMGAGIFGNVIRFLPPVVITDEQLETALNIFEQAVEATL